MSSKMSVNMKKIYDIAKQIDLKLLATDDRFNREVSIIHEDGSNFHFKNAFLLNFQTTELGQWILCFTEHFGFHIYPKEDLLDYRQFEHICIENVSI